MTQEQLDACSGLADGTDCDVTPDPEKCIEGVCVPAVCGNGRVDPGEACDDGNTVDRDGCSGDCRSDEKCGTGFADLLLGEACDDGNLLDHDGCSSTCQTETPRWVPRPIAPPGRAVPGIAYDSKRDRVVLVGGFYAEEIGGVTYTGVRSDLWEWDGRWRAASAPAPFPRGYGAVAYDSKRERTFLYGGGGINGSFGDLWEYDGTSWRELPAPDNRPRLNTMAMAYDSVRELLIVVGGKEHDTSTGMTTASTKTWIWDGTQWTSFENPSAFVPRDAPSIAFDPKRAKVVVYGGKDADSSAYLDDVWELDAGGWTEVTPTGTTQRVGAAMAWNATCECLVVFGGHVGSLLSSSVTDETATWDGQTWQVLTPGPRWPAARTGAAMVDDGHGRTLLVDGAVTPLWSAGTVKAVDQLIIDTWLFDGTTWQSMGAHTGQAAALDADRSRIVAVNGRYYEDELSGNPATLQYDTRELGVDGWQTVEASQGLGPQTAFSSMSYDESRHEMVLFGGSLETGELTADTWVLRDGVWSLRTPSAAPSARNGAVFVYDAERDQILLFGGSAPLPNGDTWTWNGSTWTPHSLSVKPPARILASAAFDRLHRHVVLFGGGILSDDESTYIPFDDTWLWDGTTWTEVSAGPRPFGGNSFMAWNPARQHLVLIDGRNDAWEWTGTEWMTVPAVRLPYFIQTTTLVPSRDGSGVTLMDGSPIGGPSQPWELTWIADRDGELCFDGLDVDGDGLSGCADPDCWSVCSPSCPPGTSCPMLDCGDGTCSEAESCRTCPADCTTCGALCGDGVCDPSESCPGDC